MADGCSDTVVSCIASSDHDDTLSFRGNVRSVLQLHVIRPECLCRRLKEVHGKVDAFRVSSRRFDISRIRCAAGEDNPVKFFEDFRRFDVFSDIASGPELNAFLFQDRHLAVNDLLLQLHVRDSVAEESSCLVLPLEYCHRMSSPVEKIRGSQSGRTGTDHRNLLARAHFRRTGFCIPLLVCIFNDRVLIALRRHRILVQTAGAGILTECRTYTGCEFREIVCLCKAVVRFLPVAVIDQVIPLRHQIVERASARHPHQVHTGLTEGHAARHAARALYLLFLLRQGRIELIEMLNPLEGLLRRLILSRIFHKSCWFSHF